MGNLDLTEFFKYQDGTIINSDGDITYLSFDKFVHEICTGKHCFMCGASPKNKKFSDEHVIPRWILRNLNIFKSNITLPSKVKIKYENYKVPCCKEYNSFLGNKIEEKMSNMVADGYNSVQIYIQKNGTEKIFLWLELIFFKTHLKDSFFRKNNNEVVSYV